MWRQRARGLDSFRIREAAAMGVGIVPEGAPDKAREGIETDFARRMSYGDYLGLDALLSAQRPLSGQHDEMLFIVIHQVQELWMKLMLHELDLALGCLRRDELRPAFKATARIGRIQRQLMEAWDVLSAMTPHDYLAFRGSLGS